jgi:putative transposase
MYPVSHGCTRRLQDTEVAAIQDGHRESEQSWKELLLNVQARGLVIEAKLAIGDGALGFWKALRQVWPATAEQRCWVHKTANGLDKLPEYVQRKAKDMLDEIYLAPRRAGSEKAFNLFLRSYEAKYPKTTESLGKDRKVLLVFYDFSAEHKLHLRTKNAIESIFATMPRGMERTKGSGTRGVCLTLAFKLMQSASRRWRPLNGAV